MAGHDPTARYPNDGQPTTPTTDRARRLHGSEHAAVLHELLEAHPELRSETEQLAHDLLRAITADDVADDVAGALTELDLRDLAMRAGRIPGGGYVHETDAAWELVIQTIDPFLADLDRRARLGVTEAATAIAVGIVAGLQRCHDLDDGTVVAYAGEDALTDLAECLPRRRARCARFLLDQNLRAWSPTTR